MSAPAKSLTPARRYRRWLFGLIIPPLCVAAFYQIENWRGEQAWRQEKEQLQSIGESLDLADFQPQPLRVPDELNAASANVFTDRLNPRKRDKLTSLSLTSPDPISHAVANPEIGQAPDLEYIRERFALSKRFPHPDSKVPAGEEILIALTAFDAELDEFQNAMAKPYARFAGNWEQGYAIEIPLYQVCLDLSNLIRMRACARIALGQGTKALDDILLLLRLAHSMRGPNLLCHLFELELLEEVTQTSWFGIVSQVWTDQELARLQDQLASWDLASDAVVCLRGDRAFNIVTTSQFLTHREKVLATFHQHLTPGQRTVYQWMPLGWFHQLAVYDAQNHQAILSSLQGGMSPPGCITVMPPYTIEKASGTSFSRWLSNYLAQNPACPCT